MIALAALLTIALAALQYADVVTTDKVLARGGYEANPVVRWVMSKTGPHWGYVKVAWVGLLILVLWSLYGLEYLNDVWLAGLQAPLVLMYGAVVFNNWRLGK
jgi:hypothetical protein